MSYLFPLSFVLNTFAMTALLIGLSLAGKPQLAAEVGIVQGATLALFYAFSANARSVILAASSRISVRSLLIARLLLLVPLGGASYYLSVVMANAGGALAVVLILRRCVEWINELHLGVMELRGRREPAMKLAIMEAILLVLALGWTASDAPMPLLGLLLWALLPLLMSIAFVHETLASADRVEEAWHQLIPHLGSTAIIGISVYVFRLLILLMLDKATAGDLFAALAIGSFMGSLFAGALGPSMALHEVRSGQRYFPPALKLALISSCIVGVLLFFTAESRASAFEWTHKSSFFWGATGLSMIGGVVMVFAQRIRLRGFHQADSENAYGPDVLMNILIISAVPYVFYTLGKEALMGLYLLSATLAFVFYLSWQSEPTASDRRFGIPGEALRIIVAVLLFFPLFFQLTGNIFYDPAFVFDSEGSLKKLPLPLSILACYGGILLLGGYKRANLSLGVIFLSFVLMLLTSIVSAQGQIISNPGKLLLLLQFILPMFALVLGQTYEGGSAHALIFEKVVLFVLAVLVPIQLVVSWLQGHTMLSPYLYLFSIYQHLQYVAVIFICGYLLSLYSLWPVPRFKMLLILLTPLIGIYAVASVSLLAFSAMIIGVIGFAIYRWRLGPDKLAMLVVFLVFLSSACYLPVAMSSSFRDAYFFPQKFAFLGAKLTPKELQLRGKFAEGAELTPAERQLRDELSQTPLAKRLHYWEYYAKSIVSGSKVFIFGHAERPDRSKFHSAHNYYLDFVYNFGSLAVLPLMGVLGYTLVMVFRYREAILASPSFLGLTVVVLFLLLVDNSLKVGLRQPYPGIITFFLWGLLLARLESLRMGQPNSPARAQ
jgi:hypothetical protein